MGNFRRNDRGGGRRDYDRRDFRRPRFGGRDRQMHNAICSNCGKDCEVPFMPTGDKPVFCSECFEKRSGGAGSRRYEDRGPRRPEANPQLEVINAKLDKILAILESTSVKPVEEPKVEKELEVQPEKPIVVFKKKVKKTQKVASTKE